MSSPKRVISDYKDLLAQEKEAESRLEQLRQRIAETEKLLGRGLAALETGDTPKPAMETVATSSSAQLAPTVAGTPESVIATIMAMKDGGLYDAHMLSKATGWDYELARTRLNRAFNAGVLVRCARGKYRAVMADDPPFGDDPPEDEPPEPKEETA